MKTSTGVVRGRDNTFLGIPYAAAPVGAGRFAAPVPHPGWTGVRDATQPGPTAPQPRRDAFGRLDMSPYFGPGWVKGHEYLTVNIWTPGAGNRSPVMVFVHGGGFVAGSSNAPLYNGQAFARDGVVLVAVNYRLGIPGFLDLPGAPRNRGLLDVVAALGWVRANIEAFGGDPDNVTLFGQSAGATIVGGVLAGRHGSGHSGLFRRAIIQSGSGTGAFDPEQAGRVTAAVAEALAVRPAAEAFAEVPDERFVEVMPRLAGLDLDTPGRPDPLAGLSQFSLVLDRQPAEAVRRDVGLIVGTNSQEGNLYAVPQGKPVDPGLGDRLFGVGSRRLAEAHGSAYTYSFDWRSPALDGKLGAAHGVELPFVFDQLGLPGLRGPHGLLGAAEPPAELATRMHAAWVAFATDGDPGWPRDQLKQWLTLS